MRDPSPQLVLLALRRLLHSARQAALRQLVSEIVHAVWDENYHISDLFKALADFVQTERSLNLEEMEQTMITVASLLEQAAQEAETPGRELP